MGENQRVVIDSDFFNKIVDYDQSGDSFMKIMNDYGKEPVFNQFVYGEELKQINKTAIKLVTENKIKVIKFVDYIKSPWQEEAYDTSFKLLFKALNGENLNVKYYPTYKECKLHMKNVGEIHSSLMASEMDIDIFLSDDNKARQILLNKINNNIYHLEIKTILTFFFEFAEIKDKKFSWSEFKKQMRHILSDKDFIAIKAKWK